MIKEIKKGDKYKTNFRIPAKNQFTKLFTTKQHSF